MKKCPKCGKKYDDSWQVCLSCNVNLVDPERDALKEKMLNDIATEMRLLKENINRSVERIDAIESQIKMIRAGEIPKEGSAQEAKTPDFQKEDFNVTRLFVDEPQEKHKKEKVGHKEEQKTYSLFKEEKTKKPAGGNFEQVLGGKWFNKLGTFAVVIGVTLLIGYSFRYFGPVFKILTGYILGGGLVLFGVYTEKKENFSVYGKTLIGGGWALNYFTTFAIHHVPAVSLVKDPFIGFLLLMAAAVAAVVHICRYKSQVATAFAYLLIFITLMMQPLTGYTMGALILVALSFIYFMHKYRWNGFVIYGMVMSYVSYMNFLAKSPKTPITDVTFYIVFSYLIIYWLIFTLAALIMKPAASGSKDSVGDRALVLVVNSLAAMVSGGMLIGNGFDKYRFIMIGAAVFLYIVLTVGTFMAKKRDVYVVSSTFAAGLAALFITLKFSGYYLTVAYIILAQVILLAGLLLKESYWRKLAAGFLVFIFIKLIIVDSFLYGAVAAAAQVKPQVVFRNLNARTILFAFGFIFFLLNHTLYLIGRKRNVIPENEDGWIKIVSYAYPAIFAMGTWLDLPKVLTGPTWAIYGVIMLQLGSSKNNIHQRAQGAFFTIGAFVRLLMSNMTITGGVFCLSYRLLTVVPVLVMLYYCQLLLEEKTAAGDLKENEKKWGIVYPYMIFVLVMLLFRFELHQNMVAPVWAAVSVAYLLAVVFTGKRYYLSIAGIAAISAAVRCIAVNIVQTKYLAIFDSNIIFSAATIVLLYASNSICNVRRDILEKNAENEGTIKRLFTSSTMVYALAASATLTVLIIAKTAGVYMTASLGLEGLVLCIAGFLFKERYWRVSGLVVLIAALAKIFLVDLRHLETIYYILSLIGMGIILLFVSYIYTKYKSKIESFYK
ncbi:MAG: DUF2339 domain-containing protein [Candidatus Omnitrophica bacterium]|nr:DUF2339 domain-containing protein [Candidatus Omnitrophota bacterium]